MISMIAKIYKTLFIILFLLTVLSGILVGGISGGIGFNPTTAIIGGVLSFVFGVLTFGMAAVIIEMADDVSFLRQLLHRDILRKTSNPSDNFRRIN